MKKKAIVRRIDILLPIIGVIILTVILECIILSMDKNVFNILDIIKMSTAELSKIISPQITISLLSITLMQLFLNNADEKIFGLSYKYIFFHKKIFKYFNAMDCIVYMLGLMGNSIISSVILVHINLFCIQIYAKLSCVISLILSFCLMIQIVRLGLIAKYKKSQIYYLICKKLNEQIDDEFYEKLIRAIYYLYEVYDKDKLEQHERCHNSYIKEEIFVLAYLYDCIEQQKMQNYANVLNKIKKITIGIIKSNDVSERMSIEWIMEGEAELDWKVKSLFEVIDDKYLRVIIDECYDIKRKNVKNKKMLM